MHLALTFQRVDPSKGGAETYVADLARRLVAAGHRVDLYASAWAEGVLPAEVGLRRIPARGRTRAGRIWNFAVDAEAALRSARPDCSVGFINTWGQDVLIPQGGVHAASLDANARRFPVGWRRSLYRLAKQANPKWWSLYRLIERRQYDPARRSRFVAVSAMVRGHLERYQGVPRDRIRIIPNAIDADRLRVADPAAVRDAFRAEHGLGAGDLVALFVGHNYRLKGLPALLDALARRLRRSPDARPIHLVACGGGDPGPIRRQAERLGLAPFVRLAGFVPDVRATYHASDFFVLPSYYDPCSLVVFEALACGLPVVTTAQNGAGEVITPGREGFVVPAPDAADALADALDRLTPDADRRAMSERARRLGREQSFENHVAKLVELFGEVAEKKLNHQGTKNTKFGKRKSIHI